MRVLLDTHLILWAAARPDRLSAQAMAILENPATEPHFSAATIWEIAIKASVGRADFHADAAQLRNRLLQNGYGELPMTSRHAILAAALPPIHRDPFDRMLVAQALAEHLTLLTVDSTLAQYSGPIRLV
jgi:PIN domain nuclease of toxin-antitoxin system